MVERAIANAVESNQAFLDGEAERQAQFWARIRRWRNLINRWSIAFATIWIVFVAGAIVGDRLPDCPVRPWTCFEKKK